MKALIILCALMLAGCATSTVTITKLVFPDVPAKFMVPAQTSKPITPATDGTIDPKAALATIIDNNTAAKANAAQLTDLQKWIIDTKANIDSGGKKHD